jgi:hypothetical protein
LTKRKAHQIQRQIDALKFRRMEQGRMISDLLNFLSGPGSTKRMKPCDMADPDEKECPSGNILNDD